MLASTFHPCELHSDRARQWTALAVVLLCAWTPAQAGVDDVLEAIKQSEFRFARSSSEVPFFPVAWAQDSYYPASTFADVQGVRPAADVNENTLSAGGVLPVSVASRDMHLLGADLAGSTR